VTPRRVHIVGAGPAGLTAALVLTRRGVPADVLEADPVVGGIARTVQHRGYRFDIGGHRFFTKVAAVKALWRELLGDDLLTRPRLSRIYFDGRFFAYPLKAGDALRGLGGWRTAAIVLSYVVARARPIRPERSFEDWVVNRFGRRLFDTFFRAYTEKVWGLPCSRIGAQWAAQRIRGLSLWVAAREALLALVRGRGTQQVRTLVGEFEYPRLGPGQMWEACAARVAQEGGTVRLGARVERVHHRHGRIVAVDVRQDGRLRLEPVEALVSTMPLRTLIESLIPAAPAPVRDAAARLHYRDFVTVALIVDAADVFPDNWIYVHDPSVRVGRIQNFKNWSPAMVPTPATTCLGLEYFCAESDELWSMADEELVAMATREIAAIGLVDASRVMEGVVVRVPKAYPVYDDGYLDALEILRDFLDAFENLQLAGRNGLHKYNNQDHAMVTGLLAADAALGGASDPWTVNVEDDYLEAGPGLRLQAGDLDGLLATQPRVPATAPRQPWPITTRGA
jgi:protoporphyrinogen oxidase